MGATADRSRVLAAELGLLVRRMATQGDVSGGEALCFLDRLARLERLPGAEASAELAGFRDIRTAFLPQLQAVAEPADDLLDRAFLAAADDGEDALEVVLDTLVIAGACAWLREDVRAAAQEMLASLRSLVAACPEPFSWASAAAAERLANENPPDEQRLLLAAVGQAEALADEDTFAAAQPVPVGLAAAVRGLAAGY